MAMLNNQMVYIISPSLWDDIWLTGGLSSTKNPLVNLTKLIVCELENGPLIGD